MRTVVNFVKDFGALSVDIIWFPLLVWTLCCATAILFLKWRKSLNPLFQYHLRTAAILSLPVGIVASFLLQNLPQLFFTSSIDTAFFIVQNPIEIVGNGNFSASNAAISWQEPSFFIGLFTLILLIGSLIKGLAFIGSYTKLRQLYSKLDLFPVSDLDNYRSLPHDIHVAFHNHSLVPFTFGWKEPVIVLPELLKNEPEKLNMAVQHELIHIKRGDYLLQFTISVVEALFWFHPLIIFANREIDTYREISCDQEVLFANEFSVKSYANLLYELVPLKAEMGKLPVSMAVQTSTLKKRINTMKNQKLHQQSFKHSIIFLLLMVIGITLPIACSDLREPDSLSYEELENTTLELISADISVNEDRINYSDNSVTTTGLGGFAINTGSYGVFAISPVKFEGASKAGTIDGNELRFTVNQLNVEIISTNTISSSDKEIGVWVKHYEQSDYDFIIAAINNAQQMNEYVASSDLKEKLKEMETNQDEDYFMVVEQMPEPVDGIHAIQSKIEYPETAREAGIEGRVTVQFIVNEEGNVEDAEVVRGIGGGADEEALRVLNETKFTPGLQKGKPVRVMFALSVNFQLSDLD